MTQSLDKAGDGLPAGPAPDTTTAAGSRPPGGPGPGVPLSVWPGLPAPDETRDGGPVTTAAARRVIDAFSLPGDLVAAAGGLPAVTAAAAAAGRPVLALTPVRSPGRPRPGVPAALPPPGDPAAATAGLAVAGWCGAGWCGAGCCGREPGGGAGQDTGLVLAACERVLRPGGVLAVITGPDVPAGTTTGTAGSVVAAARAAGLVYAQHIVLVHASVDGDHLAPGRAPAGAVGVPDRRRIHSDLLVFTKPGGTT